jgi:hypothetical protein
MLPTKLYDERKLFLAEKTLQNIVFVQREVYLMLSRSLLLGFGLRGHGEWGGGCVGGEGGGEAAPSASINIVAQRPTVSSVNGVHVTIRRI